MAERLIIPLLLLLLLSPLPAELQAREIVVQETGDETAGGGAVIEIGGSDEGSGVDTASGGAGVAPEPGQPVNITRNPGNTGIEMIIGGQSEDGVAKRGNLPVVE